MDLICLTGVTCMVRGQRYMPAGTAVADTVVGQAVLEPQPFFSEGIEEDEFGMAGRPRLRGAEEEGAFHTRVLHTCLGIQHLPLGGQQRSG